MIGRSNNSEDVGRFASSFPTYLGKIETTLLAGYQYSWLWHQKYSVYLFFQSAIDQLFYFWLWDLCSLQIIVVLSHRSPIQLDVSLSLSSSLENKSLFFGNLCCYKKEFSSFLPHLWVWRVIEVSNLTLQKGKNDPFHLNSGSAEYHFCTNLMTFCPAGKKREINSAVPDIISYKYQITNLAMEKCFLRGLIGKDSMGSWQFCWRVRTPASNKVMKSSVYSKCCRSPHFLGLCCTLTLPSPTKSHYH